MKLSLKGLIGVVIFWLGCGSCLAEMLVQNNDPKRHDRYYAGADKAFIGAAYNWSGIGRSTNTSTNAWVTMISPTYFVSANHMHPAQGDKILFYKGNNQTSPVARNVAGGVSMSNGDVWLGKLDAPLLPSDQIATYPVVDLGVSSNYTNQIIYVAGKGPESVARSIKVGRNRIDSVSTGTAARMYFSYDTVNDLGGDECSLVGGDSGGPSFMDINGSLAVIGTHWYAGSADAFIPPYILEMQGKMVGETLTVVPEPTVCACLLMGLLGLKGTKKCF
jgi:hypothetical protein